MITNKDRSGWFGASDTTIVVGNWDTATFRNWWMVKLGLTSDSYSNPYMDAGNLLEIPIIEAIERHESRKIEKGELPVYIPEYKIRVNFDGLCAESVIEIKTAKKMFSKVPLGYWRQCQVLMYATKRTTAELYAYEPTEFDYQCPYYPDITLARLKRFEVSYDENFIISEYLPRVIVLADALESKKFPKAVEL